MSDLYSCDLSKCDVTQSIMYYRPSLAANVCFLTFFGISLIFHLMQGIYTRKPYFASTMILGCTAEVIGYIGRIMSWKNPFSLNGFLIGICCITLAPAFFAAAIYFTLGDIVRHVNVNASRVNPRTYALIFIPCDIVSLILQGTGGGMASSASQQSQDVATPTHVMVAGLGFQTFTMACFILLCLDFVWRARKWHKVNAASGEPVQKPFRSKRMVTFTACFSLAIIFIFIRTIYRVIELAGGWTSKLYRTQTDFIVLEGVMVVLAVYCLHVGHPGYLGEGKVGADGRHLSSFRERLSISTLYRGSNRASPDVNAQASGAATSREKTPSPEAKVKAWQANARATAEVKDEVDHPRW